MRLPRIISIIQFVTPFPQGPRHISLWLLAQLSNTSIWYLLIPCLITCWHRRRRRKRKTVLNHSVAVALACIYNSNYRVPKIIRVQSPFRNWMDAVKLFMLLHEMCTYSEVDERISWWSRTNRTAGFFPFSSVVVEPTDSYSSRIHIDS